MPDGQHHHRVWKMGWLVIIPTTLYVLTKDLPTAFGILSGYSLGSILTPDADLVGTSSEEGRAMKILPGPIGWVWVGYWTIYGAAFRRLHRSLWTHLPFISTGIRLVYMLWWLYLTPIILEQWHINFLFGVWIALSGADTGHFVSDLWFSRSKSSNRKLSNIRKK